MDITTQAVTGIISIFDLPFYQHDKNYESTGICDFKNCTEPDEGISEYGRKLCDRHLDCGCNICGDWEDEEDWKDWTNQSERTNLIL